MASPGQNEGDEEVIFDDAQTVITQNAMLMKSVIENGSLRDALKHSSAMIKQLSNPMLCPKSYYVLCSSCCKM